MSRWYVMCVTGSPDVTGSPKYVRLTKSEITILCHVFSYKVCMPQSQDFCTPFPCTQKIATTCMYRPNV
jgi:hypothetical protein